MAAIETITWDNFESIVSRQGIVLVDCWASWCGACEVFAPVYEHSADDHPDHTFAKLDTQAEEALVEFLEVEHIPTLLLYREGLLLLKRPGQLDRDSLEDIIAQAQALDMDLVREQIREDAEADSAEQDQEVAAQGTPNSTT